MWLLVAALAHDPGHGGCPSWMDVDPGVVCADASDRAPHPMPLPTAGWALQASSVPLLTTTTVTSLYSYGGLSAPIGGAGLALGGSGLAMTGVGLLRAERSLADRGVRLEPAPRVAGVALGAAGLVLQGLGVAFSAAAGQESEAFGFGLGGLTLQVTSFIPLGIAHARVVRAHRIIDQGARAEAQGRPKVQVAPSVDPSTGTFGVVGRW